MVVVGMGDISPLMFGSLFSFKIVVCTNRFNRFGFVVENCVPMAGIVFYDFGHRSVCG